MIASLTGVVRGGTRDVLIVDVNGVGYAVNVSPSVASAQEIGDAIDLLTSLIVREDSMTLFGFLSQQELNIFESLITVSGVGPKSAMGVLATLTPAEVFAAVSQEDDSVFRAVSGIGPKTAKLIVVQLGGRLTKVVPTEETLTQEVASSIIDQVTSALVGLGWAEKVAREAVRTQEPAENETVAELLRRTLAALAQGAR